MGASRQRDAELYEDRELLEDDAAVRILDEDRTKTLDRPSETSEYAESMRGDTKSTRASVLTFLL